MILRFGELNTPDVLFGGPSGLQAPAPSRQVKTMLLIFDQYVSAKTVLLMFLEDLVIALSLILGARLRFWSDTAGFENYIRFPEFLLQVVIVVAVFQASMYYCGLYNLHLIRRRHELVIALGQALGGGAVVIGLIYYLFPVLLIGRDVFFVGMSLVIGSIVVSSNDTTNPSVSVTVSSSPTRTTKPVRTIGWKPERSALTV